MPAAWGQPGAKQVQKFVEPSPEQVSLNDTAVRALFAGDLLVAISRLEESNAIGELNITYLNLGRAYQLAHRCAKAREALDKALVAPAVKAPSPKVVESKAREYLGELDKSCGADKGHLEHPVDTESLASAVAAVDRAVVDARRRQAVQAKRRQPAPVLDVDNGHSTWGWTSLIAGTALVAGGVGAHLWAESLRSEVVDAPVEDGLIQKTEVEAYQTQQRANTIDTISLSTLITGGLAVGVGAYLLVTDGANEQPAVTLAVGDDGVGLAYSGRF